MALYYSTNGAMPTTAAQAPLATGTAIKTHQQLAPPAANTLQIVAFGVEFATALTAPATIELIETDVGATMTTAHVAAGVFPYDARAVGGTTKLTLGSNGTATTGYNASAEGATTAVRTGKYKVLPIGATEYEWEWTPAREFTIRGGKFGRIRISTGVTINVLTWILHDE